MSSHSLKVAVATMTNMAVYLMGVSIQNNTMCVNVPSDQLLVCFLKEN